MTPTVVTHVYFQGESELKDYLASSELSAIETRSRLMERLKNGEGLVAIVKDSSPRALVLRSTVEPQLKGKKDGDELLAIPFA